LLAGESAPRSFDRVVMCAGLASAQLLKPLGLKIPMAAVYGYSISAPIREPLNAPRSALMDERYKVAISRLGNRVRVAGSAEIGGSLENKRAASLQTLYKVLHDWFPGAAQLANTGSSVQEWKGARPMLPDGPPHHRRQRASPACGSTWATAPAAGRSVAAARGRWPT
jgi:D-amino-acid dehydrogenase